MTTSILILSIASLLLCSANVLSDEAENAKKVDDSEFRIGVIVDYSSRIGKEEITAMKMAIQDYYEYAGIKPVLHIRDSGQDPVRTTFSAIDLINVTKVGVILGFRMCDQVAFVAELGRTASVPVLSFADTTSLGSSKRWPFLIQASPDQYKQMRAVASIVGTWQWRKVNVIYEDVSSARSSIFPHLIDALQEVGSLVEHFLPLPSLNFSLSEELQNLKGEQCRVFIVHTSLPMANHLFKEAKKIGLMEKDSVWIITNGVTDHVDFANASVISTMQGIIGIRTYFSQSTAKFIKFKSRFQHNFHQEHPEEVSTEPGIFALQAYDAVWMVALAMNKTGEATGETIDHEKSFSPLYGKRLLKEILSTRYIGLTGQFRFIDGALVPSSLFRVVNVIGKSYRELGYWSEGQGFSKGLTGATNVSMKILGQVLWPGGPWSVPRGWAIPTSENPLTIGVPYNPKSDRFFDKFTEVRYDPGGIPSVTGYSIDVFNAVLDHVPYSIPYNFVPYNNTYDSLVEQKFDAAVGDIAIVAHRHEHVEFSHPWSDSGIQMMVFRGPIKSNRAWLFFKPFSKLMWGLTVVITIYNGVLVSLMERKNRPEFTGSASNNIGAAIWSAFATLFSLQGDRLHTNFSRMTMVVWLFVAIVIIQSYTACLASILTIPHIPTKDITVEFLMTSNAKVGCDGRSFVVNYLQILGFKKQNIVKYYSKSEYPPALRRGEISAAFLEVPYIRLLMAKYCKEFYVVGETYKVGGFGFVFPKGSPMIPDITQAVLEVEESGKLQDLENALLKSSNCSDSDSDSNPYSLGFNSFWGLFLITFGTTTIAFVLHLLQCPKSSKGSVHASLEDDDTNIQREIELVEDVPINNPNIHLAHECHEDVPDVAAIIELDDHIHGGIESQVLHRVE
ncbi:Glutamate receptor 2.2 [Thalictrum thalictroides]|uniref:Glutamate receptor n=1 Tax=Thalictrum thalictroides TaxID=46969 RepID=A0A7J6WMY0_THATH|nr:Glutamate receptor 2.2 [Thalictrum thalictroides]